MYSFHRYAAGVSVAGPPAAIAVAQVWCGRKRLSCIIIARYIAGYFLQPRVTTAVVTPLLPGSKPGIRIISAWFIAEAAPAMNQT